jgi:anti-sigma B factor antagonist
MPEPPTDGAAPVLRLTGDIDLASEAEWRSRAAELLETNPALSDVIVDMSGVTFLDSRGMAVLADLHGKALARGGKLTLLAVPSRAYKAISLAGLDQVFQVEPQ